MPYDRYLRLRLCLCLATTPPPTSHQLPCLHIHPQPASVAGREPSPSSPENGAPSSHRNTLQQELSSSVNSGRRFEAVATFRLIWWNQGSGSRKRLSIWRPIVPQGMVYFGDIAVQGWWLEFTYLILLTADLVFKIDKE
nr:uncharacterized protein LOC109152925 [Ipomoea batatas]